MHFWCSGKAPEESRRARQRPGAHSSEFEDKKNGQGEQEGENACNLRTLYALLSADSTMSAPSPFN